MVNSFLKGMIRNRVGTLKLIKQVLYSKESLSFFNPSHVYVEFFRTLQIVAAVCLSLVVKVFSQRRSLKRAFYKFLENVCID